MQGDVDVASHHIWSLRLQPHKADIGDMKLDVITILQIKSHMPEPKIFLEARGGSRHGLW